MGFWPSTWGGGSQDDPVVETKAGKVRGTVTALPAKAHHPAARLYRFRGIPYAAPPVGQRRFRKPEPATTWEGVKDCKEFGKSAVQSLDVMFLVFMPKFLAAPIFGVLYMAGYNPVFNTDLKRPHPLPKYCSEEQALNLNIETPSLTDSLPVLVFIHGGGFQLGSNSQLIYQNKECPISRKGAVLVTINYRLGVLGLLKVEGGDYNVAIWDQVMALRWVQENIARFGGDPNNVTIFGESAGAMSCATLSAGPFAGQLFHRVILQSGSLQCGLTKEQASWVTEEAAQLLAVPAGEPLSVKHFENVPPEKIVVLQNLMLRVKRTGDMCFQPVIDGELLTDTVVNRWRAGAASSLEVMTGYTGEEELLFAKIFPKHYLCDNEADLLRRVGRLLGPRVLDLPGWEAAAKEVVAELKDLETHPVPPGMGLWTSKAVTLNSLLKFALPCHVSAQALLQGGVKAVYMFRFDTHSPAMNGPGHAVDLPYVFGTYRSVGPMCSPDAAANCKVSEAVIQAWVDFARSGDPNGSTEVQSQANQLQAQHHHLEHAEEVKASTGLSSEPTNGQGAKASNGSSKAGEAAAPRLPPWPRVVAGEAESVMVVDLPLAHCRVVDVTLREVPLLLKIVQENTKALWFSKPSSVAAANNTSSNNNTNTAAATSAARL